MCEFRYPWCNACIDNFPMREEKYEELEDCGNTFYCPQGHPLQISREAIVDQMRSAKRRGDYLRDRCDKLQRRTEALKGVKTKYLNRLLRGECPYCGKSFNYTLDGESHNDVVEHIREKHAPKNRGK